MHTVLMVISGGFALAAVAVGVIDHRERKRFSRWVRTDGRIISLRRAAGSSNTPGRRSAATKPARYNLLYEYTAGQKTYRGKRVSPDCEHLEAWELEQDPQKYRPGETTGIWFDPEDPTKSVATFGAPGGSTALLALLCLASLALSMGAARLEDWVAPFWRDAMLSGRRPHVAVAVGLMGTTLLIAVLHWWLLARQARSGWVRVRGTVCVSETARLWVPNPRPDGRKRIPVHVPRVQYAYSVDGVHFVGRRIMFGPEIGTSRRPALRYERGAPIDVYVNPKDPAQAVIEPTVAGGARLLVLAALSLALAAHLAGFL